MTMDRHMFADLALAVLIALPLTAMARPQPVNEKATAASVAAKVAIASHSPTEGRIGLLG
jgi:hypothetical protein